MEYIPLLVVSILVLFIVLFIKKRNSTKGKEQSQIRKQKKQSEIQKQKEEELQKNIVFREKIKRFNKKVNMDYRKGTIIMINPKSNELKVETTYLKEKNIILIQHTYKRDGNYTDLVFKFYITDDCEITYNNFVVTMKIVNLNYIKEALIDLHYIEGI